MEKIQEFVDEMQVNLDKIKKFLEPQAESGNEEVRSIKELVIDENHYFIPKYQRGYKWDENNVMALLDDIKEFLENDKKFYCLQPVIVLEEKIDEKTIYRVLDGQQRLTTFYILCKYLGLNPQSKMNYETREKSVDFLEKIKVKEQENKENIDFYFMQNAINTMGEWFKENKKETEIKELLKNYDKTRKYMGCIWYEVKDESSSEKDIFTRVNSGKIPLTDAELIKARILNIKNFTSGVKATQDEIANEWDNIEYDLQNEEFFGFLVQNGKKYTNKIELLFEIYCKNSNYSESGEHAIFDFINQKLENKNNIEFWKEIKNIYLTLKSWFNDPELYNLIGFMLNVGIKKISEIYKESKDTAKKEFKAFCKNEIKEKFFKNEDIEKTISELHYESTRTETQSILLLFNVITYNTTKQRFSFARYKSEKWSLEHIHPQHDSVDDLVETITDDKQRKDYIELAKKAFRDRDDRDRDRFGEYDISNKKDKNEKNKEFKSIVSKIEQAYENLFKNNEKCDEAYKIDENKIDEKQEHLIGNLALLKCKDNSALSNSVFPVKRDKIKDMDLKGEFIPICTKNAFMKYYSGVSADNFQWTKEDFEKYKSAIVKSIADFFGIKGVENEQ